MDNWNNVSNNTWTGRLSAQPDNFIHNEVLYPQFQYEIKYLLPYYIRIEKVISIQYARMDLIDHESLQHILNQLDRIDATTLIGDRQENMTDILFAIERHVEQNIPYPIAAWHIDRSRNDVQATAQLMLAKDKLLELMRTLLVLADTIQPLALKYVHVQMPGYTHYQSAQIISPGFYLAAIQEQIGQTIERLQRHWDSIDECPLGSGAMSGLELPWNRLWMAQILGFEKYNRHALMGVASKDFMLLVGSELSNMSVTFTRFLTDFMAWGSSEYQFLQLPDHLCSISSAMPQKKNLTILERIRGKFSHIPAYYTDLVMGQQKTPYTNLVETAKEGGNQFLNMIQTIDSALKLLSHVISQMSFDQNKMEKMCEEQFFGGFSLANQLTLQFAIPYRQAQVLSGKYITMMLEKKRMPIDIDSILLQNLCEEMGYKIIIHDDLLRRCFATEAGLLMKNSSGSTHPSEVTSLLSTQERERFLQQKCINEMSMRSQKPLFY